MDILLIANQPPYPLYTDANAVTYHLARELSGRRYNIDLLCFSGQPEDIADIPRYERYFHDIHLIPAPYLPARALQNRQKGRFPTSAENATSSQMWKHIQQAVRDNHYDVVQVVSGFAMYEYFNLFKSLPNCILPLSSQHLTFERRLGDSISLWERWDVQRQRQVAAQLESWVYWPYDGVIFNTRQDVEALKKLAENPDVTRKKAHVLPPGVDTDYFVPTGFEPVLPALLFIGNYEDAASVEAALRLGTQIFPAIKRAVPEAELYLVGNNPPESVRKLNKESIYVTGRVPDTRPFYELATVYINPVSRAGGVRKAVLEALAMMTPVVSTPQGCEGLDELHHEQQIILGHSDEDLTKAAIRLLKDSQLRLKLQLNGREKIDKVYSWQCIADQYETLHQHLIHHKR